MSPGPLHPVGFWAAAGSSDTINLTATSAFADGTGGPITAEISCYRATHSTRPGEVWADDNGMYYQYDIVTPVANAGNYQMKWEPLSGSNPYGGTAQSTWVALSTTDFWVYWRLGSGPGTTTGSITVYIREGTGPTLTTATWDGEVVLSGKGK